MFFIEEKMETTVWLKLDNFLGAYIFVCLFCGVFMKEFLKTENLCFGHLKQPLCLKDVNFSITKNDRVLLLGLDDKGKTSLLKTLSGFDVHFFGKIFIDGKEIRTVSDEERNVSLILDEPILLNSSIDKNLDFLYETIKKDIPEKQEKQELLKKFNLDYDLKQKVKKLSKYEKFKLCFLRTFVKDSKILFIDDILKNGFSEEEINELKSILEFVLKNKPVVFSSNNESFLKYKEFFEWFKPTKVLYLNFAKIYERKTIKEMFDDIIDFDMTLFVDDLEQKEGFCVYQEGSFYLSFDDGELVLKIDKKFNESFEKLKLSEGENEDIVLCFKKGTVVDLTKNDDFNKILAEKRIMIFSRIDRSKII